MIPIVWDIYKSKKEARRGKTTEEDKAISKAKRRRKAISLSISAVFLAILIFVICGWAMPHQGNTKYNGGYFVGQIKEGVPDGEGVITYPNGTIISGVWEDGQVIKGNATYPSGNTFDFDVSPDNASIRTGTYRYQDIKRQGGMVQNSYFIGSFDVSKAARNYKDEITSRMTGTFHYTDGTEISGEYRWYEGISIPDGTYSGMMTVENSTEKSKIVGYGTLKYNDGKTYRGEFRDGQPDGFGEMVYSDGTVFTGFFANGRRNGMGVTLLADGTRENQQYVDDEMIPCDVDVKLSMVKDTIETEINGYQTYYVNGNEEIKIQAKASSAGIAFISYYFTVSGEEQHAAYNYREKIQSNSVVINIPSKPFNSDRIYLLVEAVADNDTGEPNYVTKTGWYQYTFVYDE